MNNPDSLSITSFTCSEAGRWQSATDELLHSAQAANRPTTYSVAGDCMTPVFQSGDSITVQQSSRYFAGDIVVYSDAGRGQVAHRLLGCLRIKGQLKYLITSDRAKHPDPLIDAARMLGKVTLVNRSPVSISIYQRAVSVVSFAYWSIRIGVIKRVIPHLLRNSEKIK